MRDMKCIYAGVRRRGNKRGEGGYAESELEWNRRVLNSCVHSGPIEGGVGSRVSYLGRVGRGDGVI